MVDHVKKLAKARGCKAIILDSGMPRKAAHTFYVKNDAKSIKIRLNSALLCFKNLKNFRILYLMLIFSFLKIFYRPF